MDYHKDPRWIKKRKHILARDKYVCQECKRYGRVVAGNTAHHIVPVEMNSDYQWLDENLLLVCSVCHDSFHDRVTHKLTEKGLDLMARHIDAIIEADNLNKNKL